MKAPGQPPRRERVLWIDLFRGTAVLVMVETHVVNTFLAGGLREESWFAVLNYLNGLVAPSFLFIAGLMQGMDRPASLDKPVNFARRARRLLGLAAIGYALHFPWAELAQHRWDAALRVGTQVDVLQCLAASLGLLLAVTWCARKGGGRRGEGFWWCGVVALILLAVGPAASAGHWNFLAIPLRAWVNFSTGSWFPLFPWAGFVFVGALTGATMRAADPVKEDLTAAVPAPPSTLSILPGLRPSALLLTPLPLAVSAWAWSHADHSPVSPASFLERTAWVLALAALCEWLAGRRIRPALAMFAGKHSLALYVIHLVCISALAGAGMPAQSVSFPAVAGLILAVGSFSLAATRLIGWFQTGFVNPQSPSRFSSIAARD